jgi:DNA-binding NarL/FixJ family response regulator
VIYTQELIDELKHDDEGRRELIADTHSTLRSHARAWQSAGSDKNSDRFGWMCEEIINARLLGSTWAEIADTAFLSPATVQAYAEKYRAT